MSEQPPFPNNKCDACERQIRATVIPYSSILGHAAVHANGNVCAKWINPEILKELSK